MHDISAIVFVFVCLFLHLSQQWVHNSVFLKLANKSNTCGKTQETGNGQVTGKQHIQYETRQESKQNRAQNPD